MLNSVTSRVRPIVDTLVCHVCLSLGLVPKNGVWSRFLNPFLSFLIFLLFFFLNVDNTVKYFSTHCSAECVWRTREIKLEKTKRLLSYGFAHVFQNTRELHCCFLFLEFMDNLITNMNCRTQFTYSVHCLVFLKQRTKGKHSFINRKAILSIIYWARLIEWKEIDKMHCVHELMSFEIQSLIGA